MAIKIDQPNAAPVRKIWAVIISGIITSTLLTLLTTYAPDLQASDMVAGLEPWITLAVVTVSGYMTREKVQTP